MKKICFLAFSLLLLGALATAGIYSYSNTQTAASVSVDVAKGDLTTSSTAPAMVTKAKDKTRVADNALSGKGGESSMLLDQFCPTGSLFDQPPTPTTGGWTHATSEVSPGYLCQENFNQVGGIICDIHFWGLNLRYDAGWSNCDPPENPMPFEIIFYDDVGGLPGNIVQVYNVSLVGTPTGELYNGVYEMMAYSYVMDPCVDLINGWVSIQGGGDANCWFMWTSHGETGEGYALQNGGATDYDLSLCLTGDPIDRYGACCDDVTGSCSDNVLMQQCPPPLRWAHNTLCVDLVPPCGMTLGACCDDATGTCNDNTPQMACQPPLRWAAGTLCADLDPPCGGCSEDTLTINILTDTWPGETTWEVVVDNTSIIVASGGPYSGQNTLYTEVVCVDFAGCYDFHIYDSFGDGIYQPGYYEVYLNSTLVGANYNFTGSHDEVPDIGHGCGPPPTGACCVGIVCAATNTEADCNLLGGDWYYGETCPEYVCPPGPCDDAVYSNGEYIMDYGSPASQYATDYPFAAGAADDFVLPGTDPITVTGVTAWTTHWNGAEGQGPNLYTAINVTVYADNTPSGPAGELLDNGTRIEYFVGGIVYTVNVPAGGFTFEEEPEPCTGDMWRVEIPVNVTLTGGVVYWLEIQPVMVFSGGGQAAVSLADMNHGGPAQQIFVAVGIPVWTAVGGNSGACAESPPAGTMFDLAFCLHTGVMVGACCDDYTGTCLDDVNSGDCPPGWRFVANTLCADLEPPCGILGACCVDLNCVATTLESECDQIGGTWYAGQTCPDFACPIEECPPDAIFSQTPAGNTAGTSDEALLFKRFDNFAVEEEICDIHFWGINGFFDAGWFICEENPMPFLIEFWNDDGAGMPDVAAGPACSYNVVIAGVYAGFDFIPGWPVWYYSTVLEPCCQLVTGWVSIQGQGDPTCYFLWLDSNDGDANSWFWNGSEQTWTQEVYDLAFCLTPASEPDCFEYLPGDCNMYNGAWPPQTIGGDVTYLVNYFRGQASSQPCKISDGFWCAADVNGDCQVIGSDVTKLVNYFRGATTLQWCPDRCDPPCWPPLPPDPPAGWPNCQP